MSGLKHGAVLFDEGRYYEAHEEWEHEWLEAEGDDRALLHGLIQTAAAYVHLYRGNPEAVASLASSALTYLDELSDDHDGVDVEALRKLNREVEERAKAAVESDDWRPLVLREPRFPWTGEPQLR